MSHIAGIARPLLIATVVFCLPGTVAFGQATISKCQDADGKWHYGDHAAEACESSITEIDYKGNKVREVAPPPTDEELRLKAEEQERKRQESEQAAYQQSLDERLLATYEDEESIVRARDERVQAIERSIETNESLKAGLLGELEAIKVNDKNKERIEDLKQRLAEYDDALQALKHDQSSMINEYTELLERYRHLTQ